MVHHQNPDVHCWNTTVGAPQRCYNALFSSRHLGGPSPPGETFGYPEEARQETTSDRGADLRCTYSDTAGIVSATPFIMKIIFRAFPNIFLPKSFYDLKLMFNCQSLNQPVCSVGKTY